MRKTQLTAVIFLAVVLSVFAFFSYTPSSLATAATSPIVRYTINNNSQHDFTISMHGPEDYLFSVAPESSGVFMVARGTYFYHMDICNFSGTGNINLNIYQTLQVPVCGGNFDSKAEHPHEIDASDTVRVIRVTIENNTFEDIGLYLRTMEIHHFLNLAPGETQTVLTPKDRYVYSYVACEQLEAGYYEATFEKHLILDCSE